MTRYHSSIFFLILVLLHSCKNPLYWNNVVDGRFDEVLVRGGHFWITTYQKIQDKDKPYVFYIEGDGPAFKKNHNISSNPTPKNSIVIKLAMMDRRPNVIYIARLCQYTPMELNPGCNKEYWSNKRMSDDSVEAVNEVIDVINGNQKFSLVGYSGGGGIAVLVASRNDMVKDIVTLAGNLDHVLFTKIHNVSPMTDSLNPIDYAEQVRNIPQLHISGKRDRIIPTSIIDKFVMRANSRCVKQKIYKGIGHNYGWHNIREDIYSSRITCD